MDLSIPDSLPSALQLAATDRDLVTGQVLFHRRDEAQSVFVVQTGRLKLVRYTSEGKLVILQVVRASESFAESALFSDLYGCDAVAETPSRVIIYPKQLLLTILRSQPDLAESFINRLALKNQFLKDRLELQSIRSARERVLQYLLHTLQTGETSVNFDRLIKDIAAELGLTPEALYRTLAQMEREGIITRTQRQITLRTPAA